MQVITDMFLMHLHVPLSLSSSQYYLDYEKRAFWLLTWSYYLVVQCFDHFCDIL